MRWVLESVDRTLVFRRIPAIASNARRLLLFLLTLGRFQALQVSVADPLPDSMNFPL